MIFTVPRQKERINRSMQRRAKDEAYMHGIFLNETDALIGTISPILLKEDLFKGLCLDMCLMKGKAGRDI